MAGMAATVRDIPKTSLRRDNFTAVAARDGYETVARNQLVDLPTPPNSISPTFPTHGLKAQLQKATLDGVDSDIDLQSIGSRRSVSPDASGVITCSLLAKYHLPEILLNHGPLAIRHIMGYLTTSVPGFSGIPPAKARRLVVGALEGRGGEGGGVHGDVDFEKVGWGRWDASRRGAGGRGRKSTPPRGPGIPISKAGRRRSHDRIKANNMSSDAYRFSHDDDDAAFHNAMYDHADRMSMDGSASASCSEAPDDDNTMNDDPEDMTDDEDWAAMGAAALRAESYPNIAAAESNRNNNAPFNGLRSFSSGSGMAKAPQFPPIDFSAFNGTPDAQEREAVEALLSLGSV